MQKLSLRSRIVSLVVPAAIIVFGLRQIGCQYTFSGNPDVSLVTVHVSPVSATVPTNGSIALSASITGFQHAGTVSWSVIGVNNGTIVANGASAIYTAPATLNAIPMIVQVRVTSDEDASRYVILPITIVSPQDTGFSASPLAVTLLSGGTQQFGVDTITTESAIPGVQWSLISGPGSITTGGLYTAPATADSDNITAVVSATSVSDQSYYSEARVVVIKSSDSLKCFSRDIEPVLFGSCGMSDCHDAASHKGGYDFNTYSGTIKSVRPGNARASRLYTSITRLNIDDRMPPPPQPTLTPNQILAIGQWINEGAQDCQ